MVNYANPRAFRLIASVIHDDLVAVGVLDDRSEPQFRSIFCRFCGDGYDFSNFKVGLIETGAVQHAWRSALKTPRLHVAAIVLYVYVPVDVWIRPIHTCEHSRYGDVLCGIKLRGDPMVREDRECHDQKTNKSKC